jgi:GT2 family glycosyltransferase
MDLSVVIPTRDRRERLLETLDALDQQELRGTAAEIVVVDDGSSDGTFQAVQDRKPGLPVRVLRQQRLGASAARNMAIKSARGAVILLLGDDTSPAQRDLVASHLELHRSNPDPHYAVLGRIEWAVHIKRTTFIRWLDSEGFQFPYQRMGAGPVDIASHLYSSHTSAKRATLLDVGGFDVRLPFLGEDTELGIRLGHQGVWLDYHPELLVHHDHPQTLQAVVRRMGVAGEAARFIHERWPEDAPEAMLRPQRRWLAYRLAAPAASALLPAPLPRRVRERAWTAILISAYARGYKGKPER